jgi:hypothetical protein
MFFKNKDTGLVWEVIDEDHIKRCKNDSSYEEVVQQEIADEQKQPKKVATKAKR